MTVSTSRRSPAGSTGGRRRHRSSSGTAATPRARRGLRSATRRPSRVTVMWWPASTRSTTSPPWLRKSRIVTVSMWHTVSPVIQLSSPGAVLPADWSGREASPRPPTFPSRCASPRHRSPSTGRVAHDPTVPQPRWVRRRWNDAAESRLIVSTAARGGRDRLGRRCSETSSFARATVTTTRSRRWRPTPTAGSIEPPS